MKNKRRYTRFKLNNLDVQGKMALATEVKIIDISISGISLKANRRLNIGSDYILKLEGQKSISLKGTVVWCSLIYSRNETKGEMMPTYSAGMQFKDISAEKITELQYLIESHKIEEVHVIGGSRLNIRFHIKDPDNAVLICPDNYKVKTISLGGMLIECLRNFEIESRIPMEMFIHDDSSLEFVGRVASSQVIDKEDQQQYNIGIEFLDLTEKDREILSSLIAHSTITDTAAENVQETTVANPADEDIPVISRSFIDKVDYLYKWHTTMGYYKVLDIKEYASDEQIRHAYLSKTHELHPDNFPKASEDLKQKLNELISYLDTAHSTLMDPIKRKVYDKTPITRIRH